jgi:hypothetical protein
MRIQQVIKKVSTWHFEQIRGNQKTTEPENLGSGYVKLPRRTIHQRLWAEFSGLCSRPQRSIHAGSFDGFRDRSEIRRACSTKWVQRRNCRQAFRRKIFPNRLSSQRTTCVGQSRIRRTNILFLHCEVSLHTMFHLLKGLAWSSLGRRLSLTARIALM